MTASPVTLDSSEIKPKNMFLGPASRARLLHGGSYFGCHTPYRILAVTFNHYSNHRLCARRAKYDPALISEFELALSNHTLDLLILEHIRR